MSRGGVGNGYMDPNPPYPAPLNRMTDTTENITFPQLGAQYQTKPPYNSSMLEYSIEKEIFVQLAELDELDKVSGSVKLHIGDSWGKPQKGHLA